MKINQRSYFCGRGGFTLVELMIVISVMGLIAIMALPNINGFLQSWKLNGETQEFISTLRCARSAAVKNNTSVVFSFDLSNNTYFYFEDDDGDGGRDTDEYMSGTKEMAPGIRIAAHTLSGNTLTFESKGETGNSGTITIKNDRNSVKNIRVMGGSGNIEID
ncbi:MAG: GspH/FimT family pseudopilin [Candidatus Krumholzibacteriota bacterium]|nr:GspH/FimT family pseudopilin [Candidatus Krumholzibacteriota bacterium]